MKYRLKISINTDGDFYFPYVPCGMTRDGEKYYFRQEYRDREAAALAAYDICQFLKSQLKTNKDYVKEDIERAFNSFATSLHTFKLSSDEYVAEYVWGNYSGTEFLLEETPLYYKISFKVNDEEAYRIQRMVGRLKDEDVKKAILDLCERAEK